MKTPKKYYDSPFSLAIKTDWPLYEALVRMNKAERVFKKYLAENEGKSTASLTEKIEAAQVEFDAAAAAFNEIPLQRRDEWESRVVKSMELWCYKMAQRWKIYYGGACSNDDVFQEARIGCLQAIRRLETLEMNQAYRFVEVYCNGYAGKLIGKTKRIHEPEVSGDKPIGNDNEGKTVFSTIEGVNTVEEDNDNHEVEVLLAALKTHIDTDLTPEERLLVGTLFSIGDMKITLQKGEKRNIYTVAKHIGMSKYMAKTTMESAMTKLRMAMLEFCSPEESERLMRAIG